MTEQNGIDILCDAAGSDLLLGSLFPAVTPAQDHLRAKRLKLEGDSSASASPHVCHICRKVYERYEPPERAATIREGLRVEKSKTLTVARVCASTEPTI